MTSCPPRSPCPLPDVGGIGVAPGTSEIGSSQCETSASYAPSMLGASSTRPSLATLFEGRRTCQRSGSRAGRPNPPRQVEGAAERSRHRGGAATARDRRHARHDPTRRGGCNRQRARRPRRPKGRPSPLAGPPPPPGAWEAANCRRMARPRSRGPEVRDRTRPGRSSRPSCVPSRDARPRRKPMPPRRMLRPRRKP